MQTKATLLLLLIAIMCPALRLQAQPYSLWAQSINANDPAWPGYDNPTISRSARLSNGYVVCGSAKEAVFPSRNGDSIGRTNHGGFYVARYDFNGNLLWLNYGIDRHYATGSYWSSVTVTTDEQDNIYIGGIFPREDWFYYNNGNDSVKIASVANTPWFYNDPQGFVAKLDAQGVPQWHAACIGTRPTQIAKVAGKGIILAGMNNQGQQARYVNAAADISTTMPVAGGADQFLYWIDGNGTLQHYTHSTDNSPNYYGYGALETDGQGNTYISGGYGYSIYFYNAGDTGTTAILSPDTSTFLPKLFVVKYDTAGKVLWHMQEVNSQSAHRAMAVAPDGSVYISATCFMGGNTLYFVNADQTMTTFPKSEAMIYKISSTGTMTWRAPLFVWGESALFATDTSVVFAGTRNYNPYPPGYSDTVYSASGPDYQVVHAHNPNMHLLQYDADGNIRNSQVMGNAPNYVVMNFKSLFYTAEDKYLLCGNLNAIEPWYQACTDTMYLNGRDGYMIHCRFNAGDTIGDVFDDPRIFLLSVSDSLLCPGDTLIVYDSVSGTFFPGNMFKVVLSDNWGNFSNPQELAVSLVPADSFICVLPAGLAPGNGYQLMVMSTNYNRYSDTQSVYILPAVTPDLTLHVWPDTSVNTGDTVIFSLETANEGPFPVYQWLKNGTVLAGEENDSLVLHDLVTGDVISARLIRMESCGGEDTVTRSVTMQVQELGIGDPVAAGHFSISPNPSSGRFRIRGALSHTEDVSLIVEDMTGKCLYKKSIQNVQQLDHTLQLPATLPSGVYLLQIRTGSTNAAFRLSLFR